MEALRNIDLLVLLVALPVFILVDAPIVAWAVAGAAWIAGRIGMEVAARKRRRFHDAGDAMETLITFVEENVQLQDEESRILLLNSDFHAGKTILPKILTIF